MDLLKQDRVMNNIIHSITHGCKNVGDEIHRMDYGLASKQMAKIFKTLSEKGIIYWQNGKGANNSYVLTENCFQNAQEFYFEKIVEEIEMIKLLAEVANIPSDVLIETFKEVIKADE